MQAQYVYLKNIYTLVQDIPVYLTRPMSCSNEQITTVHLHVNKYNTYSTLTQFMIISQIQFMKVWIILLLSCTRLCTYQPNLYSFDIQSTEWMFSFFFKRRISSRHIACQCMMVSVLFINTTSSITSLVMYYHMYL